MNPKKLLLIFLALLLALALSASALHNTPTAAARQQDAQNLSVRQAKPPQVPDYSGWSLIAFDMSSKYGEFSDIYIGTWRGNYEPFAANINYAEDGSPSLYPGGDTIVWASNRNMVSGIYSAKLDGGQVTMLSEPNVTEYNPAFSPDGSTIAFTRYGAGIVLMNTDGTEETTLIGGCWQPDWSPNGSYLVMNCGYQGMATIRSDGTELTQFSTSGSYPGWSPDGSKISYAANMDGDIWTELWQMDSNGDNPTLIYEPIDPDASVHPCDWSPDSRLVTFVEIHYDYIETPLWNDWVPDYSFIKAWDSLTGSVVNVFPGGKSNIIWDCSWVSMDLAAPSSVVDPLAADSRSRFTVHWSGTDQGGSGIDWYEVQVRDGETGAWESLVGPTSATSISFSGQVGHTYYFRSRAGDLAGNLEDYPSIPDAWTVVTRK